MLPGGEEVGAFVFRRTVPSAFLSAEDVRNMVGAWRDRIVVSSRFALTQSVIEALLDGGAKAVFELALPKEAAADPDAVDLASAEGGEAREPTTETPDAPGWGSAFTQAGRSAFTLAISSAMTPAANEKRDERESSHETTPGVPEDSVLEELVACFYATLYTEGMSIDQLNEAVQGFCRRGGCRLLCHLPVH